MTNNFWGYTTLVIKGTNFLNLIKLFQKEKLKIKELKKISPSEMLIKVKTHQTKKLIAILNKKCYTITKTNSQTQNYFKPFKNISIVVGIIFGILLNFFASFFVWNIHLVGDQSLKAEILSCLNNHGIKNGTFKSVLNFSEIEKILYREVENISLLSLSQKGTTIFVSYTKRTPNQKNELMSSKSILAKNDGIISSILTISGTPVVKIGDYVKKGQELICGYKIEDEEQEECDAIGQVFAYVWKSATLEYPKKSIVWTRNKNFVTNYKVMFQNTVLFSTNNPVLFEKFETEEETKYLTDKVLPIKIVYTTSYELEKIEIEQDFEKNKQSLISQTRLLCWQQIEGNEQILEEKTETNFVSDIYFITHYIKIKEKIS